MENKIVRVYVEYKPESYVGDMGIVIKEKKSEQNEIDIISQSLNNLNSVTTGVQFELV